MSYTDALGQIDQILQWEQQLGGQAAGAAPGTTTTDGGSSVTGAAGAAGATDTDSTTAATFAAALAQAQGTGDSTLLGSGTDSTLFGSDADSTLFGSGADSTDASDLLSGGDSQLLSTLSSLGTTASTDATADPPVAAATSAEDPRIQAMLQEANSLVGEPYVWGGGHDGWGAQSGYDCSGFVSAVLHAGGYLQSPQDTSTLPSAAGMESGPGQYVTVYDRDAPGEQGHVIIEIDGQFYESGGEHGSWGGGGGVEQISTPSAAYLSTFNVILHPEGL